MAGTTARLAKAPGYWEYVKLRSALQALQTPAQTGIFLSQFGDDLLFLVEKLFEVEMDRRASALHTQLPAD